MNYYDLTPETPASESSTLGTVFRGFVAGIFVFVACALLLIAGTLVAYANIASDLPAPEELSQRAGAFRSTRIYDRNGNLLNETFDPNAGRRVIVPLAQISPLLQEATIATEDANFYQHGGVDPIALARAVYYAIREREFVSGASTIPQQLVKLVFLTSERTAQRKVKEAILAAEISRRYSKEQILQLYLNEVYYGNLAYGADAAAETYFNKEASDLTLAEAALLAGLPQAPAYYDPYTFPERAKERQGVVLGLMVKAGFITADEANEAWLQPLTYAPLRYEMKAPHFTLLVRQELERLLGPEALYKIGLHVTTTLDSQLQAEAERIVQEHVHSLADRNVSNGALVAMRPDSGEILALVGSADFNNVEIDGQVNMALAPRQPGSSIKPLVYLSAFEDANRPLEERWTPGTLVADIQEEFPDGSNPPYVPTNYDGKEHGLVTVRTALANSYNIPAVRTLQRVGIPYFLDVARRLGITSLTRPDYGLSLSLGGGEIPLLELTGAFAVLANGGVRQPPISILKIVDSAGNVICEMGTNVPCYLENTEAGQQVISPIDAFLITDILRDNQARVPVFGLNSALNLGRPAAAKTGTTNDFRDALTVGYTPQLVTGVWVGNADNSPMNNVPGSRGAAPIWNRFMQTALADQPAQDFTPPAGVQQFEICADTGTLPSKACPEKATHWFAADRPPLPSEKDLYRSIKLDKVTGKLATEFTPPQLIEEKVFKVYPLEYRQWAEEHGIPQPPTETSDVFTFEPSVVIQQPAEGAQVNGIFTVAGSANVPGFSSYELQYGISHNPGAFSLPFVGPASTPVNNGVLGQWDTRTLANGPHTLRLVVHDRFGNEYESRVRVIVANPTPTPEPTPTWTPTWTPTPTVTPTATRPPLVQATPTPPLSPLPTPVQE
jgi:1A family penicillin-binding protein